MINHMGFLKKVKIIVEIVEIYAIMKKYNIRNKIKIIA